MLYRRSGSVWLNPVLVSIVAIIALLLAAGIPYRDYARGGDLITFLLGPAVVALAVPLYQRRLELWRRKVAILCGILSRVAGLDRLGLRHRLAARRQS